MEGWPNQRRNWSPEEKLEIVLEGIASGNVAEVCRRRGVQVTQFYDWKNRLVQNAKRIYERENGNKKNSREARLEELLKKKDSVIAEITAENLELKKGRWP